MRLTHMRLLVTRFDECLQFYRDVMGFPVAWGEEGGIWPSDGVAVTRGKSKWFSFGRGKAPFTATF